MKMIPHSKFTFSKFWTMYAEFQLRCNDLDKARKIYGMAIGKCPNPKIFFRYIEMEQHLSNIDRMRKLYDKFVEVFPNHPAAWIKYAEFEKDLEE